MEVVRITTAGSVDDGKSTLIGRLLHDTHCITSDKMEAIEVLSKKKGLDFTDLSLLTDGLIAEREQGITIDVAHIFFSTVNRKYIVADTPGHIEYTRNMITGASNASVFLILIDARKGVVEQTRRHFYIASLLRIKEVIVCINKMDLVNYSQEVFECIKNDLEVLVSQIGFREQKIKFLPVVAKNGDNVVFSSLQMNWYGGETLLEYLENISVEHLADQYPSRFAVQYVIRPQKEPFHDFRGYAGKVSSGIFSKGDEVTILPSFKTSRIENIYSYKEEKENCSAKESVVITLADDIDISRGNMFVKNDEEYGRLSQVTATICWMDESTLTTGKMLFLQLGINRVKAKITHIHSLLDIHTLGSHPEIKEFRLNDIGTVSLTLSKPLFADAFEKNPYNGGFILIDEFTNNTVAAGFIKE